MLAEMGDNTFELGNVERDDYRSLILSDKLLDLVGSSLTQCAPECLNCVFESHCGADPVYHHATQSDPLGLKPLSGFCARQKGVLGTVLDLLDYSPQDAAVLRLTRLGLPPCHLNLCEGGTLSGCRTPNNLP